MADTQTELSILLTARDDTQGVVTNLQKQIADLTVQLQQLSTVNKASITDINDFINADTKETEVTNQLNAAVDQLKQAKTDLKNINAGLAASGADTTAQAETGALSFGKLTAAFTLGNLAAGAIATGLQSVKSTIADSITTATEYQQQMQGLIAIGTAFGQSADQMTAAVQHLTQDGLMNTVQAATALREVMQKGLDTNQAEQLVSSLENIASFGRKGFDDLGTSVDNAANGFRNMRSITLEMNGVMVTAATAEKEYAAQLGISTAGLSDKQKTLALYNAILSQSAQEEGNLAEYADTAAGTQERLANASMNAKAQLGDALLPAVQMLQQNFIELMQSSTQGADGLQQLQGDFLALGTAVAEVIDVVVGFVGLIIGAFQSIASGSFAPLEDAFTNMAARMTQTWQDMNDGFQRIANGTMHNVAAGAAQAANDQADANSQALQRMNDQIADENRSYQEQIDQRTQSFKDSLQQMIQAHQDKVTSIKQQMADETQSYLDSVAQRQDAYNEQVASLEDSHAQKVADITQQISDEKSKGLIVDGVLYQEANQKKLDQLQDNLDKENTKYQQQLAKLQDTYNDQVQKAKEAEDKKQQALQDSLDKENKILQLHAAEVAQMGEQANEDDISRLERKYQQENDQAEQHHQDRLAQIRRQATEQGVTFGNDFSGGIGAGLLGQQGTLNNQFSSMGTNAGNAFADALKQSIKNAIQGFVSQVTDKRNLQGAAQAELNFANAVLNPGEAIGQFVGNLLGMRAAGGPVSANMPYIVGEQGPELFVPAGNGQILNNGQTRAMGAGATVHIDTFNSYSNADLSGFASELAWRLR